MKNMLEDLRLAGNQGADLSPGDPVCKWAYEEIEQLQIKNQNLRIENHQLKALVDEYREKAWKYNQLHKQTD